GCSHKLAEEAESAPPGSGAPCLDPSGGVSSFDSLDAVLERLSQHTLADGPEHESEDPPFEVLALSYHDGVQIGRPVEAASEGVGVAGPASPDVRVGRGHDDTIGIGPVVVQAFPDASRAL